jgi:formylglycine-generating enzyme
VRWTGVLALAVLALACTRGPEPLVTSARVDPARREAKQILVRGGTLVRGREGGRADEAPRHEVLVSDFWLDETLVTRSAFDDFVRATHHVSTADRLGYGLGASEGMDDWAWERIPGASYRRPFWEETADHAAFTGPEAPVVMTSYDDAVAYCTHREARLPTEAEWEYAMRAGSMTTRYPWGEEPTRAGRYALNFWQGESHAHNDRLDGWVYVSPVKAYPPNAWGFYDPVGNVWQWTSDWYSETTYRDTAANGVVRDPRGPSLGTQRTVRGGSWWCGACTCEGNGLFYRGKSLPSAPYNNIGFRCAR